MGNLKLIRVRNYELEMPDIPDIAVGDKILIPLDGIGDFTATVHKVTDSGILLIFDYYVTGYRVNENCSDDVCFEKSDLKKWMDTELLKCFPSYIRDHIEGFSIPSIGEVFGHDIADWCNEVFEPDTDEQLPLMKDAGNRTVSIWNQFNWGWMRNATKAGFVRTLACMEYGGVLGDIAHRQDACGGVRPEVWISK